VDVLVGNEEDLQLGLGVPGPEAGSRSKLNPSAFFGMIDNVISKFPQIKVVATTLCEVHSTNRHSWGAVAWIDGKRYVSPTCELDVYDRVGGGDGFASDFFYGLLTGESEQEAVNLGWAHGALLTNLPRRYHHGDRGAGADVRQGRFSAHLTLMEYHLIR
jgi:2-dehydro-3-deoxygluconokinase